MKCLFWLFLLISCTFEPKNPRVFFENSQRYWPERCRIRLVGPYQSDTLWGYRVWMYDGEPSTTNLQNGVIFKQKEEIWFLNGDKTRFVLFDFGLKAGGSRAIEYEHQPMLPVPNNDGSYSENPHTYIRKKKYTLTVETIFHDPVMNDSIFKFRFRNYGI